MAVAPDGTVYVTDTFDDRIQAFGFDYPWDWRGGVYDNRWLARAPVAIRQDWAIDLDWGTSAP